MNTQQASQHASVAICCTYTHALLNRYQIHPAAVVALVMMSKSAPQQLQSPRSKLAAAIYDLEIHQCTSLLCHSLVLM